MNQSLFAKLKKKKILHSDALLLYCPRGFAHSDHSLVGSVHATVQLRA